MIRSLPIARPRRPGRRTVAAIAAALALAAAASLASAAEPFGGFGPKRFGPIAIEGNSSTRTDLILHELHFAEGDSFRLDLLDRAWEHLEDLGWFAFVDMAWDEDAEVSPVTITVEEDRTTRYYPLIDYDRRHDIRLGVKVYDLNFRGRGERLSLETSWYRPHAYRLGWKHPWLLGVRGLSLDFAAGWESADFVYRDWDYTQWDGVLGLCWIFASPIFAETGLAFRSFDQQGDFAALPGHPGAAAATRERWEWRVLLGVDSRDIEAYPTRGAYHRIGVTRAMGEGLAAHTVFTGDLRQFLPVPWFRDHVLALHAWGRRVEGHLPPEDMLFWGGPGNIRGYRFATIEGEEGYLLSCEYRWPLFLMPISGDGRVIGLGLHAFADLGDAWFDGAEPGDGNFSWGGGAHVNISTQQFRFEIARTEDGQSVFQFEDSFNF